MEAAILVGEKMPHDGLVCRIARSFRWAIAQVGMEERDLIQFGRMGVMRALRDYDPARAKFSTYAAHWIRHYIRLGVWKDARAIRIPVNTLAEARKRGKHIVLPHRVAADHWSPRNGQAPGDMSYFDMKGIITDATAESDLSEAEQAQLVAAAMETLSERERDVVRRRFGIGNARGEEETLEAIGNSHGITRERTRQIQVLALERLKRELGRQALKHSVSCGNGAEAVAAE